MSKHKPGDNITLLNTSYHRPVKDPDTGKRSSDYITLIYKDLDKDVKEHKTIYNPQYTYYKIKDEYVKPYPQSFIELDKVEPITTEYNNILRSIATVTGRLDEFKENLAAGEFRRNRELHFDPRIMASDIGIEAFYRMEFNRTYKNDPSSINKSYLDIEADIKYIDNRFPNPGEVPINAISFVVEKTSTEYVFLLKDKNNPLSIEFEEYVNHVDFSTEFKDFLTNAVGGWKNMKRMNLDDFKYKLIFYDNEIELITAVFRLINLIQPDFVLSWNMAFDIPYIIERIKILGYDPRDIMCHPDFEEKSAFYYVDQKNLNDRAERTDFADISSYSVFMDQMIQFASRRKGQSAFTNFKLDYIGEIIANVRKLDYHHITDNLGNLPYIDYKIFVMYNMMDTMVQKCIEEKTGDINYVYNKSILNSTEYSRVHRQTVYLANRAAMFYREQGLIIGNNVNRLNPKPEEKFTGAYVAPPVNVSDYSKQKLYYPGQPPMAINVAHNGNDFDYTALYPSEAREHNVASNTLIGKILIEDTIYDGENFLKDERYNRAGEFSENLTSHCWIEIGHRWLNLGTYEEVLNDIYEYFTNVKLPARALNKNDQRIIFRKIEQEYYKNILYYDKNPIKIMRKIKRPFTDNIKLKAQNILEGIVIQ